MYGFQWIASLHPKSGIAESLETSSSLIAAMTDDDNHNRNDKNIHDNKKISRRSNSECKCISSVLRNYPYWLCSFGVTFGLLKAKIVDNNIDVCIDDFFSSDVEKKHLRQSINMMNNNNVCSSAVQICTSLFGIELLTFGIPDVDDNKHQYIISSTLLSSSRKSNAVKHDDSSAVVSMEFPVVSGLLAYKPAQGSIRFDAHYSNKIGQKNRSSITTNEYAREARSVSDHTTVSLESRVVNYRPAIVGGAEPVVNPLRRVAYLLTQRYVHAYVMRRFHNHFHQSMQQQQHSSN